MLLLLLHPLIGGRTGISKNNFGHSFPLGIYVDGSFCIYDFDLMDDVEISALKSRRMQLKFGDICAPSCDDYDVYGSPDPNHTHHKCSPRPIS
jgi:hypothetical protein